MDLQQQGEELKRGLKNRHIQLIALGGAIGTGLFLGIADTIKIAQVKPHIVSRHLINLSRLCMADYVAKPLENGLDGEIGAIYFRAAHGIEEIHMYEQMAECFCIYGDE